MLVLFVQAGANRLCTAGPDRVDQNAARSVPAPRRQVVALAGYAGKSLRDQTTQLLEKGR